MINKKVLALLKNSILIENNKKYIILNTIFKKFDLLFRLKNKQIILILAKNSKESICCYLSCLLSGNLAMVIDDAINDEFLNKLINLYKPNYIFAENLDPKHKQYKKTNKIGKFAFYKSKTDYQFKINKKIAVLLTTSGSTGTSKLVKLTYENILENTKSIKKFLNINFKDVGITNMPMSYTYGLSVINTHVFSSAKLIVNNYPILNKFFWQTVYKHKVTNLNFVPFLCLILKKLKFDNFNLNSLRLITSAGGSLEKSTWTYIAEVSKKKNIVFIPMYGATEATSRMSYLPSKYLFNKLGSIGKTISGGEFKLINKKNIKINEPFKVGEIIYSGKNVFKGYAKNVNNLKNIENFNELKTGDMGYFDHEGFYFVTGRKDRYVKIFGNRVNLDEIEKILNSKSYETACCHKDEKIILFFLSKIDEEEIKVYLSLKTNLNKNVFEVKNLKEFPKKKNGKIDYEKLKKI